MKKCLAFLLICSLMVSAFLYAVAEEQKPEVYTSGDWEYILLEDGTAEIKEYNNKEIETVEIPEELDGKRVTGIGDDAFCFCQSLASITIPDSVTSIGDHAFFYCRALTTVTIPDSVTSIGINPFSGCDNLTNIIVSPEHPVLVTINGVLFDKTEKKLICYPCALKDDHYEIPEGIRIIGDDAFDYCEFLTSITIPDSVTGIGDGAFEECKSLSSITIPDGVTSIGKNAFSTCRSLSGIIIPDSVTSIGENAFSDCDSLTVTVGRDSYAAQYCKDNGISYQYPNDWLND